MVNIKRIHSMSYIPCVMEVVLYNPRGTKALWLPYLPNHLLCCQQLVQLDGPILPTGFYEINNPHRTSQLVSPPDSISVAHVYGETVLLQLGHGAKLENPDDRLTYHITQYRYVVNHVL